MLDSKKQGDFTASELREIETLLREHLEEIQAQLQKFYSDQQVTAIRKPWTPPLLAFPPFAP